MKNKIVFITGASSGIGEATARRFAKEGADLLLCARRVEKLSALALELEAQEKIKVYPFGLDVRDKEEVKDKLSQLPPAWLAIDILINNAGLAKGLEPLQKGDPSDWDEMIDTNIKGLLYITRWVLPKMLARNQGHIINIGSVAGHVVYPKGAVYCATKHAVLALTQGLRMDVFGTQIRVTTIDPGMVETDFSLIRFKGDQSRAKAVYKGLTPLSPHDIADTIHYCASRPPHVNIDEVILMPTAQAHATMVYRDEQ